MFQHSASMMGADWHVFTVAESPSEDATAVNHYSRHQASFSTKLDSSFAIAKDHSIPETSKQLTYGNLRLLLHLSFPRHQTLSALTFLSVRSHYYPRRLPEILLFLTFGKALLFIYLLSYPGRPCGYVLRCALGGTHLYLGNLAVQRRHAEFGL